MSDYLSDKTDEWMHKAIYADNYLPFAKITVMALNKIIEELPSGEERIKMLGILYPMKHFCESMDSLKKGIK